MPDDEECEQGAEGPDESLEGLAGELKTCLDVRLMISGATLKALSPSPVLLLRAPYGMADLWLSDALQGCS